MENSIRFVFTIIEKAQRMLHGKLKTTHLPEYLLLKLKMI